MKSYVNTNTTETEPRPKLDPYFSRAWTDSARLISAGLGRARSGLVGLGRDWSGSVGQSRPGFVNGIGSHCIGALDNYGRKKEYICIILSDIKKVSPLLGLHFQGVTIPSLLCYES